MSAPRFSVIVPTYGRPLHLGEALRSIFEQSRQDFEIVVVDDASPDPVTLPMSDERVRLIRAAANGGPGAARNLGAEKARGTYLAFLDDDDIWMPNRLELAEKALGRAPIAVCWQRADRIGRRLDGHVFDTILDDEPPQFGAVAVDRSVWQPIDPSYRQGEDVVWWLGISQVATVATVPEVGIEIRSRPEKSGPEELRRRLAGNERIMRDFADYFRMHPRARAYRARKAAKWEASLGNRREALKWYSRSLLADPNPAVMKMAAHALLGR
jgi:glycosyltransferase involved in cell wall biosynthesis